MKYFHKQGYFWLRAPKNRIKGGRGSRAFIARLFLLRQTLHPAEKAILYFAIVGLLITTAVKGIGHYLNLTVETPAVGGVYRQALVGQPEFLNPILAQNSNDKVACSLIYDGLISMDNKNQAKPLLADSWEVSVDQKEYLFHLKTTPAWPDGRPFVATDVVYTYAMIKDQNQKSPYYFDFKDVEITEVDQNTVKFKLINPYGPFISNLNIGIIPNGSFLADLNAKPIGLGRYRFTKSNFKGSRISKVLLERSPNYYNGPAFIKRIELIYTENWRQAEDLFNQEEVDALPKEFKRVDSQKFSFDTSAKMMLIFNLRKEPFSNLDLRRQIVNNQVSSENRTFEIIVSDNPELVTVADRYKEKLAPLNYQVKITALKENDYKERIKQRNFEATVIGIDFGHTTDPYSMWHSSQDQALNIAGYKNPKTDYIIEGARVIADQATREAKFAEVDKALTDEAVRLVLESKKFSLSVDDDIKNISLEGASTGYEYLNNIGSWYIKMRRVRKVESP